jgi:hypothetical protein
MYEGVEQLCLGCYVVDLLFFLGLVSLFLVLAFWVFYRSAVLASLAYSDRIKAAFDLYRWKLLEELHRQLPTNLEEERCIWREVSTLLYYGYDPNPSYFKYK